MTRRTKETIKSDKKRQRSKQESEREREQTH